jgi:rhodanese-related sulfurtransferase
VTGPLTRLFPPRPKATAEQARDLQRQGAVLLDVRQHAEWRAGHAPGAWHIPLSRLHGGATGLPPRRAVVTICRSGHRSALAAALPHDGCAVASLAGGMRAWPRAELPVVAAGGRPGRVV